MGSVRKASAWLGLVEDNDERYYDDEYAEGTETGTGNQAWVTDPGCRWPPRRPRSGTAGSPR